MRSFASMLTSDFFIRSAMEEGGLINGYAEIWRISAGTSFLLLSGVFRNGLITWADIFDRNGFNYARLRSGKSELILKALLPDGAEKHCSYLGERCGFHREGLGLTSTFCGLWEHNSPCAGIWIRKGRLGTRDAFLELLEPFSLHFLTL